MINSYIGLGSNLGNPIQQVQSALQQLAVIPDSKLISHSRLYGSAPLGGLEQPDYVNAVACLATNLEPVQLLRALQAIELAQGRQRGKQRWQSRTLDLDLLLYGDRTLQTAELTIPHYAIAERSFVILPLIEIAPDILIPGHGPAATLAERLDDPSLRPLES